MVGGKYGIKMRVTDLAHSPNYNYTINKTGPHKGNKKALTAINEAWQKLIPWIESKQREQLYGYNLR
ncbi:MAG: hypothetical protein DRZ80_06275 [Thermoprotei archaeon]|nr:MAG: hypothetical protein DRZ80_06275 [Thermoprotei archaeon]